MLKPKVILVAGPTASGKSSYVFELAKKRKMAVVNADSMQVYRGLPILTAQPTSEERSLVPHYLYGTVENDAYYSVGAWYQDVKRLLSAEGLLSHPGGVIFVGGTGLYFRALEGGIATIPEVDPAIRSYWRAQLESEGADRLHQQLVEQDIDMARRLHPHDGQRIVRALEVLGSSGKSLSYWQMQKTPSLIATCDVVRLLCMPPRAWLISRIEQRLEAMMDAGVLGEVEDFLKESVPLTAPINKVIGLQILKDLLKERGSKQQALDLIAQETRQYAKRQQTWFRNQMREGWQTLAQFSLGQ